jgi:hypothetical protein
MSVRELKRHEAPARSTVTVCEWQDGRIEIYYREQRMQWDEIAQRPATATPAVSGKPPAQHRKSKAPPMNHPFKQKSYQQMLARKTLQALRKGENP